MSVELIINTAASTSFQIEVKDQDEKVMPYPSGQRLDHTNTSGDVTLVFDYTSDPAGPRAIVRSAGKRTVDDTITIVPYGGNTALTPVVVHVTGTNDVAVATSLDVNIAPANLIVTTLDVAPSA